MNSTDETPNGSCDSSDKDSGKAGGSYIEERKSNVEYLDLHIKTTISQKQKELTPEDIDASTSDDKTLPVPNENDVFLEQKSDSPSFDNEYSDMYTKDGKSSPSTLKRTIAEANLDNPENRYLTLDEIEERKKSRFKCTKEDPKVPSNDKNSISTGKFDSRGRPIPGLAKLPQVQNKSKQPFNASNMLPQGAGFTQSLSILKNSNANSDGPGKIYVGGMPPSLSEPHLHVYFSQFGIVKNVTIIRDHDTGISKGFGFVTFSREEEAGNVVTMMGKHVIDRRPVRVSFASTHNQSQNKKGKNNSEVLDAMHLPEQARLYMGPLEEDVIANDVTKQFCQFGTIHLVQRIRASETTVKKSFGFVDYHEGSSAVCRAFGTRQSVRGRSVHLSLSKFVMELLLSDTCIFFYEAYEYCDEQHLDQHFSQFGQVYRALHIRNDPTITASNEFYPWKNYGFIDFVSYESSARALEMKTQLLHPGQYVRVGRTLPQALLYDLMAISDKYGTEIKKGLESHHNHGMWGDSKYIYGNITTSQVRIPVAMVGKLIGERGKSIAEITRDSKVKINIPKVDSNEKQVVISITGQKENIKTAQYLMQKLLKGQK